MKNFKKILRTVLNETLDSKTNKFMGKSKSMEMEEMFDSNEIKSSRNGRGYDKYEFKGRVRPNEFMKDFDLDSTSKDEFEYRHNTKNIKLDDLLDDEDDSDPYIEGDDEPIMEGEMCECGGMMKEGECMECGSMYENLYKKTKPFGKKTQSFDYIEEEYEEEDFDFSDYKSDEEEDFDFSDYKSDEEEDFDFSDYKSDEEDDYEQDETEEDTVQRYCDEDSEFYDENRCQYHSSKLTESKKELSKLQKSKLDKNKNNKIDAEDFKLLRKSKSNKKGGETNEKFPDLSGDGKVTRKDILMGRGVKLGKKKSKPEETVEYHIRDRSGDVTKLSEDELIDFIENIVNEENKSGLKTIGKPKGLTTYEKAHKGSGKENSDYLKSVSKKMNDYLKDGSKGKFDMNPKIFPKGNGELAKMNKKGFKMTDELQDFNYEIAGQQFPTPDEIEYNEDWMNKLFDGDSMTGNAPGGNALKSDANDRFNKMRKKNVLKKVKDQSYKRAPQPVFKEKTGSDVGKLNIKTESYQKEERLINEEFNRIKELLHYDRKTQ